MEKTTLTTETDPAETLKWLNMFILGMISLPIFLITVYKMPDVYLPLLLSVSMLNEYDSTQPRSLIVSFLYIMLCCQCLRYTIMSLADIIVYFGPADPDSPSTETRFEVWTKVFIISLILFVVIGGLRGWPWDGDILHSLVKYANSFDFTRAKPVLEDLDGHAFEELR